MNYITALRSYTAKRIEDIENADILMGIPCYNNETTIEHVIQKDYLIRIRDEKSKQKLKMKKQERN
jgi:hypothetical protein